MQDYYPKFVAVPGPFIVENGKVLLVREQKPEGITPWFLPGGRHEATDADLEATAKREAKEEVGVDIQLVRPLSPLVRHRSHGSYIIIPYLATYSGEIVPGPDVVAWGWHDIKNLPDEADDTTRIFAKEYLSL